MTAPQDTRLIQLALDPTETEEWRSALATAIDGSGLKLRLVEGSHPAADIDYLVYNIDSGITDFAPYTRLRAILNTWAGVEGVVGNVVWPPHVPFCRMVEPGLSAGMVEYFVAHTMRYHVDIDRFQTDSAAGRWHKWSPPLAGDRTVGVLGLGALGSATARQLAGLGFQVCGWSRTAKSLEGVSCLHGESGLRNLLAQSEILIVILPLTPQTRGILNAATFAQLPEGACIVNAGRGPLIDDEALLAALASGRVRHATLDVFDIEPLPREHPFWGHPQVTVTPHIAAITRPDTAAAAILDQIRRDLDGEALLHVVDPDRGY